MKQLPDSPLYHDLKLSKELGEVEVSGNLRLPSGY